MFILIDPEAPRPYLVQPQDPQNPPVEEPAGDPPEMPPVQTPDEVPPLEIPTELPPH